MKVMDLNGCTIEVTNLDEAIAITAQYKEYSHEDKNYSELDKRQKAYWSDMYEKLITIKKQLGSKKRKS